ncbi:MAG: TonB-dependent receptor [Bacteroidales bacterium]|nr:TonB-dependent receptor [Bacteroidales bacterium]
MKRIKQIALIALQVFALLPAMSQEATLKGFVYDNETGEPVMFASIRLTGLERGVAAGDEGFYILQGLPAGNLRIKVFSIGYDTLTDQLYIEKGMVHVRDFHLRPVSYELNEIQVSADKIAREKNVNISGISILPEEIKMIPSTGSMPDIIQHIQTLPGIVSSGDIGGQIYIRGGAPVQNKTLLDGATIYNPIHSIGLFSVFDPDIITRAEVFTGGFEARYGGAISSVMDITSRYGNVYRYAGKAELSTIGTKLTLEGPLMKRDEQKVSNTSFLFNLRHCFYDEAIRFHYNYTGNKDPFSFTDLYGKTTIFAGNGFKANLFGFHFTDHAGMDGSPLSYDWINKGMGSHLLIMPFRSSALMEGYFAVSHYQMELTEACYVPRSSVINTVNAGLNFIQYFGESNLKYGIDLLSLKTDYLFYSTVNNATNQLEYNTEVATYMQLHLQKSRLILDPGMRLQYYASLSALLPEPRLALKFLITNRFRIKFAAGLYSQNLLSGTSDRDIINFFNGYLSAPVNIKEDYNGNSKSDALQKSEHIILGFEKEFAGILTLNAELFRKHYPQLINYNRNKLYNDIDHPEKPDILTKDFVYEEGHVEGIDLSVKLLLKNAQVTLNYSLSNTQRSFEKPDGSLFEYHPHYDRRHNVNLMAFRRFGKDKSWLANVRWHFGSGFPFTKTVGFYENLELEENAIINYLTQNGNLSIFYDEINRGRLPYYQRVDAGIRKYFVLKGNLIFEVEFNIINLFNEENIFYIDRMTGSTVNQLPFLPGLRAGIEF